MLRKKQTKRSTASTKTTTERRTGLALINDAADYLGCSRETIRKMMNDGRLPFKLVGSHRRIPWVEVYRYAGEADLSS